MTATSREYYRFMAKKKRKRAKKTKPLWTLDDGITFSGLNKWSECREQFSLQWIDGVTRRKLQVPLEFGSVFHSALENQDKGTPEEVIQRVSEHYKKYRLKTIKTSGEKDDLNLLLGLAQIVFPHYCEFWRADDVLINWVSREEKFSIPYDVPTDDGIRKILLRGMRDGIYSVDSLGTFGIFETKTMGRIVDKEMEDKLRYDMQTMMYTVATYLDYGQMPNAVKLNVVKRPTTYRRKKESVKSYLDRIEDDVARYPEQYFKRYTADITPQDVELFIDQTLNPLLNVFIEWWDSIKKNPVEGRFQSPYHFLNCSALVGRYGKADMWEAIFGNMRPYSLRAEVFPELEESSLSI
jgi:hypothetical protein